MAITSGFFDSINGDRRYNAEQMSTYFEGLVSDGIYENIGDKFIVTAGTGMTINVGSGRALIKSHWIKNDALLSLTLDAADVQLPRIDLIVLRLDLNESGRNIDVAVKKGTPAERPVQPAISVGTTVYELVLAAITVNKNTTEILQSNISDRRSSSQCGWVTGIIKQVDTSDLFLQWQTAYENYYAQATAAFNAYMAAKQAEFESWFSNLTATLNVDTSITKYQNTVEVVGDIMQIMIGIPEYDSSTDVLFTYVGGVFLIEGDEYTVGGSGNTAKITLVKNLRGHNVVTFVVLKNVIGGSVTAGTSTAQSSGTNSSIYGIVEEAQE